MKLLDKNGSVASTSHDFPAIFMYVFYFVGDGIEWLATDPSSWRSGDFIQVPPQCED
jgi:hypothetical protein